MQAEQGRITRIPAPIRTQVVEAIRSGILHGRLAPGQRLIERVLCEELDVSRNTLREALRQLEAAGWIDITPHGGPRVAVMSNSEAQALYEVRQALECLAIRLFVQRAKPAAVDRLMEVAAELRRAHDGGDVTSMLTVKQRLYEELYAGAGNEVLSSQAGHLQDRLFLLRQRSLASNGRAQTSIDEIEEVMQRIAAGDATGASELWERHIHEAARAALGGWTGSGADEQQASQDSGPARPHGSCAQ